MNLHLRRLAPFDQQVDAAFDHVRGNTLADRALYLASESANHSLVWHALTWILVLLGRLSPTQAFRIAALLGIESALVNGVIKSFFRRERPTLDFDRPHHLRTPLTSSFPSGHATSATLAVSLLWPFTPIFLRIPLVLMGTLIALSRIHVKIHHASDVLGGVLFGIAFGVFARLRLRNPGRLL